MAGLEWLVLATVILLVVLVASSIGPDTGRIWF